MEGNPYSVARRYFGDGSWIVAASGLFFVAVALAYKILRLFLPGAGFFDEFRTIFFSRMLLAQMGFMVSHAG